MFFGGERFPGVPIFIFLIIHYRSARFLFCLILFACLLLGDVISLFSQLGRNIDLLAPLARISTIDHQQGGKELFLLLFLKKKTLCPWYSFEAPYILWCMPVGLFCFVETLDGHIKKHFTTTIHLTSFPGPQAGKKKKLGV